MADGRLNERGEPTGFAGVANPPRGPVLKFGNPSPMMQYDEVDEAGRITRVSRPAAHLNQSVTTVQFAGYVSDEEFVAHTLSTDNDPMLSMIGRVLGKDSKHAVALNELMQIVATHVGGGLKPTWVSCEDPELARAVGQFYNCPVSQFKDGPEMLLTNGGRDNLHSQGWGTAAQPAAGNYMALTANATAAAATDTTLTAEIATAGGGLIRKQGTFAHTAGTNTSTLSATFTANGTDVLPVTVAKIGIFNASSVGTMVNETLLNATATLTVSGDSVAVTDTITLG